MKKSFALAALLLVLSTGLFAAAPAKSVNDGDNSTIIIQPMRTALGFGVSIQNTAATKAFVTITDNNNHVILLDKLGKAKSVEKAYNLSELENGTYMVTVNANNSTVTKKLHVYEEYGNKAYLFLQ